VSNNEIVLNVGFDATSGLDLGNEFIQFKARFGGVAREILVPVDHVVAIYARENGQGMAFPMPSADNPEGSNTVSQAGPAPAASAPKPGPGLRLASSETPTAAPEPAPAAASAEDTPPEPTPPAAGGGRPALKRIK